MRASFAQSAVGPAVCSALSGRRQAEIVGYLAWPVAALLTLLAWLPAAAQPATCEDRLREREGLLRYYEATKARDVAEAVRTIAEQQRLLEQLRGDLDALRKLLPAGQTPGGPK